MYLPEGHQRPGPGALVAQRGNQKGFWQQNFR